jgi:hypothetical protein
MAYILSYLRQYGQDVTILPLTPLPSKLESEIVRSANFGLDTEINFKTCNLLDT